MTLHQLFLILMARYRTITLTLLVTVVTATGVGLILPAKYMASTSLVIDLKGNDPVTGAILPAQLLMMSSYMATEIDIIQSHAVALKVVKQLRLAEQERWKEKFVEVADGKGSIEDWLAGALLAKIDVKPSHESRIVDVNFTNEDPEFAASVANAFAHAYIQTNLEMKVAPARDSATWFDGQTRQLREQLEAAQARLSRYQTEKGITSTDQKLDVEVARLAEISSQLVQVQAQAYENASRQKQLEEFTSKHRNADSLPEVLASPVIQELKARLSVAEARLGQASTSLGVNHPEYLRAQSEVTSVRKKLDDEIRTVASVIDNNLRITQGRERELQGAVAAQKAKLLELNRHRDELGVLMKEVENAQRAYESASQRHTETSMESRLDQSNVVILNPAIVPVKPAFPKFRLIIALAIAVGTVLGIALAMAIELIDRRVRGAEDLVGVVGAPVWGVLEDTAALSKIVDRKSRKAAKRGRFLKPLQEPTLG
jgi:chain length determinant protein EpsF